MTLILFTAIISETLLCPKVIIMTSLFDRLLPTKSPDSRADMRNHSTEESFL